eukprot:TRINITY_DN54131_c0_g1_i1.p1 TRINITY_DN54131_c0_g1~~TRINITY_DN54131_c0_g1_i1.p1  ORF type:complete len:248 (-),score=16.75 TRINITY_DN54131_c0_g1_i1:78-821(-)
MKLLHWIGLNPTSYGDVSACLTFVQEADMVLVLGNQLTPLPPPLLSALTNFSTLPKSPSAAAGTDTKKTFLITQTKTPMDTLVNLKLKYSAVDFVEELVSSLGVEVPLWCLPIRVHITTTQATSGPQQQHAYHTTLQFVTPLQYLNGVIIPTKTYAHCSLSGDCVELSNKHCSEKDGCYSQHFASAVLCPYRLEFHFNVGFTYKRGVPPVTIESHELVNNNQPWAYLLSFTPTERQWEVETLGTVPP